MSSTSERSYSPEPADHAYNPEKLIEILFGGKLVPVGEAGVHDYLKVIYNLKPECFQPTGGIHNSQDGKQTYQSLKLWLCKNYYQTIHIYGIMRGKQFKVSYYNVKQKERIWRVDFQRPDGGGGGGGGGSRYSEDRCPW